MSCKAGQLAILIPDRGEAMQDRGYQLRRMSLLGTLVNKCQRALLWTSTRARRTDLPSPRRRLQRRVVEGAVGGVDGRAGRHDLVDAVQHVVAQDDVGDGELGLKVLHGARPDQRRGDGGVRLGESDGELDERESGLRGELGELLHGVELALVVRVSEVEALRQSAGARGGLLTAVLAPAARQPAAGQRAVGHDGHGVPRAGGKDVGLDAAYEDRVGRLLGDEPLQALVAGRPLCLDDLAGRESRGSDVADLALVDQVGERRERLFDVGSRLGAVDLVEVDPVGVEPAQRVLDRAHDPAAGVAAPVGILAHGVVELRGEDYVVAPAAGERLADDLLGLARPVDVGGVDEVDARVERTVDDPDGLVVVGVAPGAEHHRAEAELADRNTGTSEWSKFHKSTSQLPGGGADLPDRVRRASTSGWLCRDALGSSAGEAARTHRSHQREYTLTPSNSVQ